MVAVTEIGGRERRRTGDRWLVIQFTDKLGDLITFKEEGDISEVCELTSWSGTHECQLGWGSVNTPLNIFNCG
jgi:hypothetical protein